MIIEGSKVMYTTNAIESLNSGFRAETAAA